MWQDEIVSDFSYLHTSGFANTLPAARKELLVMCKYIAENAHSFWLEDLGSICEKGFDNTPFTNRLYLPFEYTMLCYNMKDTGAKKALLCQQNEESILIIRLTTHLVASKKIWLPVGQCDYLEREFNKSNNMVMVNTLALDDKTDKVVSYGGIENMSEELKKSIDQNVQTFLLFSKLLSCKNIKTEEIKPIITRQMRRHPDNKHLYSYYVLNITGKAPQHTTTNSISASHNRVHFCRGHFKQYTPDAPLFGQHTGLYWWEPHLRGQDKSGFVDKDYKVEMAGAQCSTAN
jgi:hypothetical protein